MQAMLPEEEPVEEQEQRERKQQQDKRRINICGDFICGGSFRGGKGAAAASDEGDLLLHKRDNLLQ